MTPITATDPVCDMQVNTATAITVEHDGRTYFFCEPACADTFRDDPERWIPTTSTTEA